MVWTLYFFFLLRRELFFVCFCFLFVFFWFINLFSFWRILLFCFCFHASLIFCLFFNVNCITYFVAIIVFRQKSNLFFLFSKTEIQWIMSKIENIRTFHRQRIFTYTRECLLNILLMKCPIE